MVKKRTGGNETHFLLSTFRRAIFRLCLLSSEGSALWQCTDSERLSSPPVFDYSLWSVRCQPLSSLSPLGVLAESGLVRCSVCPVEFFSLSWQPVLPPFFCARKLLDFLSLVTGCIATSLPSSYTLFLGSGSFNDVHYCFSDTQAHSSRSFCTD